MSSNNTEKLKILDAWFLVAIVGYLLLLYGLVQLVSAGEDTFNVGVLYVTFFVAYIAFISYLASKVVSIKRNVVKWLVIQGLLGIGGFIWYYAMVYRKKLLFKVSDA